MTHHSLHTELESYWLSLSQEQRKSMFEMIHSLHQQPQIATGDTELELKEAEASYHIPWSIVDNLNKKQKKALVGFLQAFGIEPHVTTIEEYNREIDEAMAGMDAGEFVTHEEVVKELEKRFGGK